MQQSLTWARHFSSTNVELSTKYVSSMHNSQEYRTVHIFSFQIILHQHLINKNWILQHVFKHHYHILIHKCKIILKVYIWLALQSEISKCLNLLILDLLTSAFYQSNIDPTPGIQTQTTLPNSEGIFILYQHRNSMFNLFLF